MSLPAEIAKHVRGLYFGGNWTDVDYKKTLEGLDWKQATTKVHTFNTIATLIFHTNYYISIVSKVLSGGALEGNDKLSFDHPPILSQNDWEQLLEKTWTNAENFAILIEQLPEEKLWEDFSENKYGNYYKNLHGIIEHHHYHLGQIVLIRKIVIQEDRK